MVAMAIDWPCVAADAGDWSHHASTEIVELA